jgi:hypothetical protein
MNTVVPLSRNKFRQESNKMDVYDEATQHLAYESSRASILQLRVRRWHVGRLGRQ